MTSYAAGADILGARGPWGAERWIVQGVGPRPRRVPSRVCALRHRARPGFTPWGAGSRPGRLGIPSSRRADDGSPSARRAGRRSARDLSGCRSVVCDRPGLVEGNRLGSGTSWAVDWFPVVPRRSGTRLARLSSTAATATTRPLSVTVVGIRGSDGPVRCSRRGTRRPTGVAGSGSRVRWDSGSPNGSALSPLTTFGSVALYGSVAGGHAGGYETVGGDAAGLGRLEDSASQIPCCPVGTGEAVAANLSASGVRRPGGDGAVGEVLVGMAVDRGARCRALGWRCARAR